ncbi:MAG: 4-hydroxy-3-methylbut-2-enyl diphosphate reductase [Omnitrophica bacterium GWA2_52_8]|nr:MAG: 4-hydroxy-3-methylbut-2-enyl diphosphate reductase [Omnitrophica bacterium GWA2_52_8]
MTPTPANSEIIRKSFGLKEQVKPQLVSSYHSPLIERIKANGYLLSAGRLTFHLAEEFGFCYGVDRAIDYAYETKAKFPDRRIFLTNEIIHNPKVNKKLREMGIQFLSGPYGADVRPEDVRGDDVVIIPAFGTTLRELAEFQKKGCVLVDTTCGSVMSVWKRVESYSRDGFTSIIHGKYAHEETQATCSRAVQYPQGRYLVVRDLDQARKVCDYILGRLSKSKFEETFCRAVSTGFDPDQDLGKIGCANQTTMLSSESMEIANRLQAAVRERYGESELPRRFRHFDTICSATQERQDAVNKLVRQGMDLMMVVGGFNSSNTGHLAEISSEYCPAYHIHDPDCILSGSRIRHKKAYQDDIIETDNWLPEGAVHIGMTAGASTPNRMIEEVIFKILEAAGIEFVPA